MIADLLKNNRLWAAAQEQNRPGFFRGLEGQQTPRYLWIGCSDSRVPANEIVGMAPGEIFVHRNVANLTPPQDANYLSVLQYAVEVLKVRDILVVGHYGCGGVRTAVDGERHGLIDHWLHPIREVCTEHREELDAIGEETARLNRLCELNVLRQVRNVTSDIIVRDAWRNGQRVAVHGWVYSLATGLITDLDTSVRGPDDLHKVGGCL